MISFGFRAQGDARRRPLEMMGDVFYKGEWMESGTDPILSPTVFLAEQPANCVLDSHFHRQNQFQLFVEGEGTIGKETLAPVTVHYAGAYTGYGPILSGNAGLKYFTIRHVYDTGLTPVSEWRGKMIRGPKRHAEASAGAPWTLAQLSNLTATHSRIVIAQEEGLGAVAYRMPPDSQITILPITQSAGHFVFVLAGAIYCSEQKLELWDHAFVPATDGEVTFRTMSGGAEVISLHIPHTQPEYIAS